MGDGGLAAKRVWVALRMDGQHGRGLSMGSSPGLAGRNGNLGRVVHAPLVGVVATHRERVFQAGHCSNAVALTRTSM